MKKTTLKNQLNVSGFSLVEVIATIVILSIILLSFFPLFINSAKTTKMSESIVDSTYFIQKEMENIYNISKVTMFSEKEQEILKMGYAESTEDPEYKKSMNGKGNVYIKIPDATENLSLKRPKFRLKLIDYKTNYSALEDEALNLSKVIIELYDDNVLKTKVENTIEWRPDMN